ncbi:FMN-binding protein MioC [Caviibacterium pharyngocola]|uniref:FMN-binding protein MioC n=1 Tax=Caviibacterium pharyngocola TaxID=28159 RepID=A0A2M8RUG8_9PAST|nr:FMN-binding protein MioC [Caviibacterium pharyngocola]PJG82519.1 FMN-binding protein MioC [Caviibacterium pharyngocola]
MKETIAVVSGSTLGSAEYVAEHLNDLLQQDFATTLIHGAHLDDIIEYKIWLIVTSTHGAGELPDNLKPLFKQIRQQNPNLTDLRFAVVCLGNSDYDTFCFAADTVQSVLTEKSAVEICPCLKIDTLTVEDNEQYAENWLPQFIQGLA